MTVLIDQVEVVVESDDGAAAFREGEVVGSP